MTMLTGKVQSHTVIRVPGLANVNAAPFVLLLVDLDDGRRLLGHFSGHEPPAIDTRVIAKATSETPLFHIAEGYHEA